MTLKVLMQPTHREIGIDSGVGQVLLNYERHFPDADMEVVIDPGASYDITVSHLGFNPDALVHHNHGLWIGALGPEWQEQNASIIESARRAREVVVPSDYVASYFRRDMRIDPAVVGHGVNLEEWDDGENRGYVFWDKNRVGDACNPSVVAKLAKWFPDTKFVTTFATEKLPNIYTTGRIPYSQAATLMRNAGVYLATTKETFGISTLQALASGVPVVGYRWGGTADIITHGVDGLLVEPGDEEGLCAALSQALENRAVFSDAAREAAKRYSWTEVVRHIKTIYERAMKPRPANVSVIIPCYNYAHLLPRAVKSVESQTLRPERVIIVDDGSTDNTPAVAEALRQAHDNIMYIRQTNAGVANARNTGVAYVTTTYVSCLDADDEMHPAFLKTMVDALEKDRSIKIAYSKIELAFPNGERGTSNWPADYDANAEMQGKNQVPTCCVFERDTFNRLGGYKQRYCPRGFGAEDAELWLRFAKHGYRAKLVTEKPLFIYHLGGNTSRDYQEPAWLDWHTDLKTQWYPFAAVNGSGAHIVTEYDQPVYSVIIPVGPGHEIYLEDALDSVEAQSDKRWECIVVWNIRPDLMIENPIVDRIHFAYPFVRFVSAIDKQGAGYARNVGVQHSRGKYLVFLDADDYLQPRFLELTRKALEHYGVDWVYTDIFTQTSEGVDLFECYDWDIERLWRHGIMAVTCLYPRAAYDAAGGFDEQYNREDWDFHLRLARAGKCGLRLPIPLFTYRQQLGFRREYRKQATSIEESQAMKREDVARLHATFDTQELITMCRGCTGKKVEIQVATPNDLITMVYIGSRAQMANEVTFIGPVTGERYRTSNGKLHNVHPQDATAFEERRLFKPLEIVQPVKPIVADAPKTPAIQQLNWEQSVKAINEEGLKASLEARTETERFMESIFGKAKPQEPEPPTALIDLSAVGVKDFMEWLGEHKDELTPRQIAQLKDDERNGKQRVTILRELQRLADAVDANAD